MSLVLDAIEARRRQAQRPTAVNDAVRQTKDRSPCSARTSIDENGDTTLTDYGLYTIKDGELTFDKVDQGQAASLTGRPDGARPGAASARPRPSGH